MTSHDLKYDSQRKRRILISCSNRRPILSSSPVVCVVKAFSQHSTECPERPLNSKGVSSKSLCYLDASLNPTQSLTHSQEVTYIREHVRLFRCRYNVMSDYMVERPYPLLPNWQQYTGQRKGVITTHYYPGVFKQIGCHDDTVYIFLPNHFPEVGHRVSVRTCNGTKWFTYQ